MQFSKKSQEGYLMVDHRFSPGLTEEEARLSGFDPKQCGEGKLFEAATLTCKHCKVAVVKNPLRTRDRPFCMECHHYICDLCAFKAAQPGYVHTPFDKIADDIMTAAALGSPPKLIMP
jgi:hypothetical protein